MLISDWEFHIKYLVYIDVFVASVGQIVSPNIDNFLL